ncbi:MAG: CHAT domain-containing protein [Bacteroidales bacterium]|nr:CHAT domain-containing protein [Bacteroidales bacterium]
MKTLKIILTLIIMQVAVLTINAQDITADTVLANQHFKTAEEYYTNKSYDTAIVYFEKASILYEKHKLWRKYLLSETKHGKCCQKLWQIDQAITIIKPAIEKTLLHINENDAVVADAYHRLGLQYYYQSKNDSTLFYWKKTLMIRKEIFGEKHIKAAKAYNNVGIVYVDKSEYDKALQYHFKALQMRRELFGEKHTDVAASYNNIGVIYVEKDEYDLALKYYYKSLQIKKELLGEKHIEVAGSYNNIGIVYRNKDEYDLALQYYFKSLRIKKELLGEKNISVARSYNNIGFIYDDRNEYNLALQYYSKSLQIKKELLGEKHTLVASSYNNIGVVYGNKNEYDLALQYHFKSLQITKELLGEKHTSVACTYNNIGSVYRIKSEYDKALEYLFKSMGIKKELLGEKHTDVALTYNNIGVVYKDKNDYDLALQYHLKALQIKKELLGEKHTLVASSYNNIGIVYKDKKEYDLALKFYQKATASSLRNFNDTVNIYSVPVIKDYLNWNELLKSLKAKAEIFADTNITLSGFQTLTEFNRHQLAIRHYQACDTLISQVRKNMKTKSDKIALGTIANEVYKGAIDVCLDFANNSPDRLHPSDRSKRSDGLGEYEYRKQAFYFSEKNKSSVLLESLAGAEAQKFAGIPDTLLKQEHKLQINIALYKKILAEGGDSIKEARFNNKLFKANRSYDSLIVVFENNYPEYYDLKYNQKPVNVKQVQNMLDKRTALISYFTGDSTITIFILSKKEFDIMQVDKPESFEDKISEMRENISNTNFLAGDNKNNTHNTVDIYQENAFELYNLLFPKEIKDILGKKIENLIIIPDGRLATLPFEALLTQKYTATWTDWKNKQYFFEMPYLVKDYNISYTYSTNLFYKTFNKSDKQKELEITDLNDWLAFAPVFDNENISGTAMRTRKLLNEITKTSSDTIKTRAFTRDGMYISELPGSLSETKSIVKLFADKNKKALLKTHLLANEEFLKSGELSKYRYLHFATHGIVNEEKPELSGLILAQDTTSSEDNILFTGEIYNIKLNADLTVMSACETGLGKITEGEGVIGLTRALLYAGSKNIIVSLWQVSDASTNKLMVDFYKNFLNEKKLKKYNKHLRNAKLQMIEEGKYAHPFFWSPFILIGE